MRMGKLLFIGMAIVPAFYLYQAVTTGSIMAQGFKKASLEEQPGTFAFYFLLYSVAVVALVGFGLFAKIE